MIENGAFDECKALTSVHIPAKTVEIQGNPFWNIDNSLTIYAPKGSTAEQFVEEWQESYYKWEKSGRPYKDKSVEWIAFEPEEDSSQS